MKKNYGFYFLLFILFIAVLLSINFYKITKKAEQDNFAGLQKYCEQNALIFYKKEIVASTTTYLAEARWDKYPYGCYLYLKGSTTTVIYEIGSGSMFGELR